MSLIDEVLVRTGNRIAERYNLTHHVRALVCASWVSINLGHWVEAIDWARKAMKLAEEFLDNGNTAMAAIVLSLAYAQKGDFSQAFEYSQLGVKKAPGITYEVWSKGMHAMVHCLTGDSEEGVDTLKLLLEGGAHGYVTFELLVLANLCEGLLLIGRDREMRQPTERLLHLAESRGANFHAGLAHRLLGEMQLLETDTALPHFNEAIAIFRQNEQALPPDASSSMSTVSSRGPDVGAPLAAPDHPSWSGRASPCPYNCQEGVFRHPLEKKGI